jgi:exocyst complex protein 7
LHEPHAPVISAKTRNTIKRRFQSFNDEFSELYATQWRYLIADDELREQMRCEVINTVLPPYRIFFSKYANIDFSKNKTKYVRYTPEILQQMLNRLFEGATKIKKTELNRVEPDQQ